MADPVLVAFLSSTQTNKNFLDNVTRTVPEYVKIYLVGFDSTLKSTEVKSFVGEANKKKRDITLHSIFELESLTISSPILYWTNEFLNGKEKGWLERKGSQEVTSASFTSKLKGYGRATRSGSSATRSSTAADSTAAGTTESLLASSTNATSTTSSSTSSSNVSSESAGKDAAGFQQQVDTEDLKMAVTTLQTEVAKIKLKAEKEQKALNDAISDLDSRQKGALQDAVSKLEAKQRTLENTISNLDGKQKEDAKQSGALKDAISRLDAKQSNAISDLDGKQKKALSSMETKQSNAIADLEAKHERALKAQATHFQKRLDDKDSEMNKLRNQLQQVAALLLTLKPQPKSVSDSNLGIDIYLSRNCDQTIWDQALQQLPDDTRRVIQETFAIRVLPLSGGASTDSNAKIAFIIHLETGRWLMDITEPLFNGIRAQYPSLMVIILKPVKEDRLPELLDKSKPDVIFQLTVSRPNDKFMVDPSPENRKRASFIETGLDSFTNGVIGAKKHVKKVDPWDVLAAIAQNN